MAETRTLKLTGAQEEQLFQKYRDYAAKTPQYAKWQLKLPGCVITCYQSGKTVFQGSNINRYTPVSEEKTKDILPQAGSDEVGTGDFFGPVIVCASIVRDEDLPSLKELGIKDSKAIPDERIMKIGKTLMEKLDHSLLILDNARYNRIHDSANMNAIKARLHNKAYCNLSKKASLPSLKIIDQFCAESSYYRYLQYEEEVIRGIHFETKAENKYISVGASSIIARYAFLTCMQNLEDRYGLPIIKGASSETDACAVEFVRKFGWEELSKVAKMHFANTKKIRELV